MTDAQILDEIQSVLLEPRDQGATFPSGLWTAAEVLHRLNERTNRFLKQTKLLISVAQLPLLPQGGSPVPKVPVGTSVVTLPQDWLLTADLVWRGDDGTIRSLVRADSFELDHGEPLWPNTYGTPGYYLDYDSPVLQVKIAPPPDVPGTLELLYVAQGEDLDGSGIEINCVAEFTAAASKYGTLADLFGKDGRGKSPERAQYCEQRYVLGQEIAEILLTGWSS